MSRWQGKAMGKGLMALVGFLTLSTTAYLLMEHLHTSQPEMFDWSDSQYKLYLTVISMAAGIYIYYICMNYVHTLK